MRFRFIGDPAFEGEGPASVLMYGPSFNRTDWTEVADADVARRLSRNSHFEAEKPLVERQPFERLPDGKRKPGRPPGRRSGKSSPAIGLDISLLEGKTP